MFYSSHLHANFIPCINLLLEQNQKIDLGTSCKEKFQTEIQRDSNFKKQFCNFEKREINTFENFHCEFFNSFIVISLFFLPEEKVSKSKK